MDWDGDSYTIKELKLQASSRSTSQIGNLTQNEFCRSAGKSVDWDGNSYTIEELTEKSFSGVDIALFSAGGSISKKFGPIASDAGCTVTPRLLAGRKSAVERCSLQDFMLL